MKLIVCIVMTLTLSNVFGQESNNGKKLWADSFLNKKAPEFVVEEWISQQPKLKGKFILIDPKGIVRWEGFPFLQGHELTAEVIEKIMKKYK